MGWAGRFIGVAIHSSERSSGVWGAIHLSFLHSGKEGEGMMGWLASADASSFSLRMASRTMWAEYVGGVGGDGDGDG